MGTINPLSQFALRYTINIGDQRSKAMLAADQDALPSYPVTVHWREARTALRAVGFGIKAVRYHVPDFVSEGTHVVELDASLIPSGEVFTRLYGVANALHQDCIAVRVRDWSKGNPVLHEALIGPRRDAWLPFNPAFFQEVA